MATTRSETANVPKFDDSNFQLWKFSVTILLKAEKLLTIVNGKDTEPEDKKSSEWTAWDTKNSRAQAQKTEISKELLWQKFYEYRMSENAKIAEHISAIELLVKQLKDVDENISNSAICSKVINSLPSKHNAFLTAWDSVS
ncbi:hypothetical protein ILUMI_11994, partial [Ignelater luminosus]